MKIKSALGGNDEDGKYFCCFVGEIGNLKSGGNVGNRFFWEGAWKGICTQYVLKGKWTLTEVGVTEVWESTIGRIQLNWITIFNY